MSDLDGLRVEFMDGGVLHYRAPGNAPELRCYVEAQEENRALDLLNWGLDAARHALARKGHMPI
jgi:phosphomannomutase